MTTDFTIEEIQWLNGMKDPGAADEEKIRQCSFCGHIRRKTMITN